VNDVAFGRLSRYLSILKAQRRPLKFLVARVLATTALSPLLTIRTPDGRFRFFRSNLSEQLWIDPGFRHDFLSIFRDYLKPGDVYIDVGANIGDTVVTAAKQVGPTGRVWAFEPHPRICGYLRQNLGLNAVSSVDVLNLAVGNVAGEAYISDDRRDDMNVISAQSAGVPVRIVRLAEVIPGEREIALLKIDVEGYEKMVLDGCSELLGSVRALLVEVGDRNSSKFDSTSADVMRLLGQAGFTLFLYRAPRTLMPIDERYRSDAIDNVLAIRDVAAFAARTGWQVGR
jgi:FkbM family methyltransferase